MASLGPNTGTTWNTLSLSTIVRNADSTSPFQELRITNSWGVEWSGVGSMAFTHHLRLQSIVCFFMHFEGPCQKGMQKPRHRHLPPESHGWTLVSASIPEPEAFHSLVLKTGVHKEIESRGKVRGKVRRLRGTGALTVPHSCPHGTLSGGKRESPMASWERPLLFRDRGCGLRDREEDLRLHVQGRSPLLEQC